MVLYWLYFPLLTCLFVIVAIESDDDGPASL